MQGKATRQSISSVVLTVGNMLASTYEEKGFAPVAECEDMVCS
jgi:hypothetical protein